MRGSHVEGYQSVFRKICSFILPGQDACSKHSDDMGIIPSSQYDSAFYVMDKKRIEHVITSECVAKLLGAKFEVEVVKIQLT